MRVHVADAEDAVMRLARIALGAVVGDDEEWLAAYFAPEAGDHMGRLTCLRLTAQHAEPISVTWSLTGSEAELLASCAEADVLVLRRAEVTPAVLDNSRRLRRIVQMGEGIGNVDIQEAQRRGISFHAIPRASLERTAEHVMLLMLAVARKLTLADSDIRKGRSTGSPYAEPGAESYNWTGLSGLTGLKGRRLAIIGLGAVGRRVVPLARGFGMTVAYSTRCGGSKDPVFDTHHGLEHGDKESVLRSADFVTLHVKQLPGWPPVMGRREFAIMKRGSYFINTSRGACVDEDALHEVLIDGHLAGAGLDVHHREPRPPDSPLCHVPNVILTPHVAGGSRLHLLDEIRELLGCLSATEPVGQ